MWTTNGHPGHMASESSHRSKNPVQGHATMPGVLQSIAIADGVCAFCRGSGVRIEGILSLSKKKLYCRRQEPHSQKCSTRSPSASSRMTRTTLPSRRYVSFFRQEGLKHSEIISKALLSARKQRGSSTNQVVFLGLENSRGNSLSMACVSRIRFLSSSDDLEPIQDSFLGWFISCP